jgi:hypothetical protein
MDAVPHMPNAPQGSNPQAAEQVLQAFANELTTELGKLDELMKAPCPGTELYSNRKVLWNGVTYPIGPRWSDEKDKASRAFWRIPEGKTTSRTLPSFYSDNWSKAGEANWKWLTNDGVRVYEKAKFFEMQTDFNKKANIPACAVALAWFVENVQKIDDVVGTSKNIFVKGLLERKIQELEGYRSLANTIQATQRQWSSETKTFLTNYDPEKHVGYKKLLDAWLPGEESAFFAYKTKWTDDLKKRYRLYVVSHEALVAVADPIIQGEFMGDVTHIKYWKGKNIAGELGSYISKLKQQADRLR